MECRKRKSDNYEIVEEYYYLDPLLNISEDLYEMIFQHFCCEDFKNASLLNRHWYEATGMSKVIMRKIRLQVDFKGPQINHDMKAYHDSFRQYMNINIVCPDYFRLAEDCINILRYNANSLVHLQVWGMNDRICYLQPMVLPKLETLLFVNTESNAAIAVILRSCTKLKVLNMLTSRYHPSMIDCLLANRYLKELHLSRDVAFNLLAKGVPPFQFQLNKLAVKCDVKESYSDDKLFRFIRTQHNLTIINFFGVSMEILFKVMNDLPILEIIEYRSSPIREYRPITILFPNLAVRTLLFDDDFDSLVVLKNILECCPRLEQLTLNSVSPELLNFIVITNMQLKRVYYKTDVDSVMLQTYKTLKSSEDELNREISFFRY